MTKICFQIYKRSSPILRRSGSLSPQISSGFGNVKPWTEEQRKAAETRQEERRKMDESLSNQIGF